LQAKDYVRFKKYYLCTPWQTRNP